jgi:hypothetical protein
MNAIGMSAAATINNHAAAEDDDEDEDDEDNEAVFKPNDWDELSDDERQAKVKAFLRKIAKVHLDARDQKPFLKNLNIGDQSNPWGIKVAGQVKTFDRVAHRYGHSPNESTIRFPNVLNQGHDEDHRNHPLHKIAQKRGFQYSHTTPVTQHDRSVQHHHTWQNSAGHQIGAAHVVA